MAGTLFYAVKEAFGYNYPNHEPVSLARQVCALHGGQITQIRFYTGIPDKSDNPFWNYFWTAKLAVMGKKGIHVFSRSLRYRNQTVRLPDNSDFTFLVGQENGIDVRLALDAVRLARQKAYDVALIFSQDQDLTEAVEEIKDIAEAQKSMDKGHISISP
jgi:hypothetical protein